MKKPDLIPIQEQREELNKIAQNIQLVTIKQLGFPKSTFLDSAEREEEIKKIVALKKENLEGIIWKLRNIASRIKTSNIYYLVFLVGTETLDKILDSFFQIYQRNNQQLSDQQLKIALEEGSKQFDVLISTIIKFANYQAPQFLPYFSRNYYRCKNNLINEQGEQQIEMDKKKTKEKESSMEEFRNILAKLIEIKPEKKKYNHGVINQIFKMVLKHESRDERADDLYEEISLNWIKHQLEEMKKDRQYPCCKTIFFKDEKIEYYRKKYFELRPFTKIPDNSKLYDEQLEIAQTIAAFMNSKGGVIILGIGQEQGKPPTVVGFDLEQKYKKQIVKLIRNAVNEVLPKHKCFETCTEQSQHYYNSAYELNYYISIQFMNVVKPVTFDNCRHQITSYQKLYICKIAVKMGHPRYLYYVLKNEGNKQNKKQAQIQFFVRGEESNEKETLDKNYDLIYKKLTEYAAAKNSSVYEEKQRVKIHEGCLYDMSMKPEVFYLEQPDMEDD